MKTEVKTYGIGFSGLLTIAFIVLKLIGVITWSWWWVLCPLWIPFAVVVAILLIGLVVGGIGLIFEIAQSKRKGIK